MKNNSHKKRVFQDNFIKHWCCSSHNHPSGWKWWKRHNRKANSRRLKSEMHKDIKDVMDSRLE